jgi:hypothetical protein
VGGSAIWAGRNDGTFWRVVDVELVMIRAVLTAGVAVALLAVAACGSVGERGATASSSSSFFEAHGLQVRLPSRWQPAREVLTPGLEDPREVLAVATFPLRYRRTACSHVAGSALEDLASDDAFVTLQERGLDRGSAWLDFPERPAHFGPQLGGASEASACVPSAHFTDHWFGFTAQGRHFHADVAFGPQVSASTRAEAWEILDSLRVDPRTRPDWRSAG